jgi:signal peptidase I
MDQHNTKPDDSTERTSQSTDDELAVSPQRPMISIDEQTDRLAEEKDSGVSDGPKKPEKSKMGNELFEWVKALAIAGLLVFVIRWFLVSPFIVDGPSMQPNFLNRERIIVNKIIYDIREPKRGEVIVFHVPQENRDFIKRVIGEPGDTVKVEGDTIYINGQPIAEPYLADAYAAKHAQNELYNEAKSSSNFPNNEFPDGKVPDGMLFVMGDNRSNSEDSRMIGYIPMDRVVGRADLVFWPLGDFHFVKH